MLQKHDAVRKLGVRNITIQQVTSHSYCEIHLLALLSRMGLIKSCCLCLLKKAVFWLISDNTNSVVGLKPMLMIICVLSFVTRDKENHRKTS